MYLYIAFIIPNSEPIQYTSFLTVETKGSINLYSIGLEVSLLPPFCFNRLTTYFATWDFVTRNFFIEGQSCFNFSIFD